MEATQNPTPEVSLIDLARKLLDLKQQKKDFAETAKASGQQIGTLSDSMVKEMDDCEMEKFTAFDTTFYVKITLHASLPAENREKFIRRLRARKLGHIVKPTINANTLTAFVKEQIQEFGQAPDWIADLVNTYSKPAIATRKA